jgi:nitrogen fixation protein NifU and related proteins
MDLYRAIILDHYKHPRNFGVMKNSDGTASLANATCGDKIQMDVKLEKDKKGNTIIVEIQFSGVGCAISQAAASMLTERVKGESVETVKNILPQEMIDLVGGQLTPSRVKCATLPLEVLIKALVQ